MRKDVMEKYDILVKKQQSLADEMSNLGREKDYKVQKIEKQYNSKIDNLIRQQQAMALRIEAVKKYIDSINYDKTEIINKKIGKN